MLQVYCADVNLHMPPPLAKRMSELMTRMYGEYLPVTCEWVATGDTQEQLLDIASDHVRAQHAVRSWPPEFWVHLRACIREAE